MPRKYLLLRVALLFGSICCHAFLLNPPTPPQRWPQVVLRSSSSPSIDVPILNSETDQSFTDKLLDCLRRNDTSTIVVEGYVTSKRTIGKNLAFLDLQVHHQGGNPNINDEANLCQALLRKDVYNGSFHEGYRRCLLKGSKFRLQGVAAPTRIPGNVVLMLHSIELLALPRQAQHIQIILQHAVDGCIPFDEVVRACSENASQNSTSLSLDIEGRLGSLKQQASNGVEGNDDDFMVQMGRQKGIAKELKILAKDILRSLPEDSQYPVAADQKVLSKEGNFVVPPAPKEWQIVPEQLKGTTNNDINLIESSRVKEVLEEMVNMASTDHNKPTASVFITGWVQNRRRFDGNITMAYLVDNLHKSSENSVATDTLLSDSLNRLPCLVHPDVLRENGKDGSGIYQNLIGSGSKVQMEGRVVFDTTSNDGTPYLLWVESIHLLRSSSRSVNVRHLLDLLYQKQIDPREAAEALLISHEEAKQLSSESDPTQRQWKANLLAIELQKEASSENNSMRRVDPLLLEVMERYKYLAKIHPVVATEIDEGKLGNDIDSAPDTTDPNNLMTAKRMGMPGSKWQIKKKPQLEWMGRQIRQVLESHPEFGKRKLTILDIGGGKGALANYLGQNMGRHINVHVVDISQAAVKNGKRKATRLDLPVDFQFADASNSNLLDAVDADVVVALHACGHLSDIALNHAVHRQAGFVIVPCCFNSNPHLMIPSNDDGRANLTPVPEWLGLPVGDWAALKLLAEVQDDIPLASEAIGILCAIRAEAAKKKNSVDRPIAIKSFPIQYSTRNTVLVGKCS